MNAHALPSCKTLVLARERARLYVTLSDPATRNALSPAMREELSAVLDAAARDDTLRALILRGANGVFCSGGNIGGFREAIAAVAPPGGRDPIAASNRVFGDLMLQLHALPKVVIAVVEGPAFGGGFGLACAADIAIAKADAKFALSEATLGLVPAQIAPFVVKRVGLSEARRLALTGTRIGADEAYRIGLVHYLAADDAALEKILAEVLDASGRCAIGAIAATKEVLLATQDQPVSEVLDRAAELFAQQMRGPEGHEGVAAFLEKRPANWVDKCGVDKLETPK
jgi:isohexenylglutaconyl-CoA hydratase